MVSGECEEGEGEGEEEEERVRSVRSMSSIPSFLSPQQPPEAEAT